MLVLHPLFALKSWNKLRVVVSVVLGAYSTTVCATSVPLTIKSKQLEAELACSSISHARGLMHRETLPADYGMLFIFPDEDYRSFWMKNTSIPLSIAYVDQNKRIVEIRDLYSLDETPRRSSRKVKYALEVNQGWFRLNQIKVGDKIKGIPADCKTNQPELNSAS